MAQGKNWMMSGERALIAALTSPRICSMLYAIAAMTAYPLASASQRMRLWMLVSFQLVAILSDHV